MSFQSVQGGIARKEGVSSKAAGAILASSTRNASPAVKRANPNLKNVKGKAKTAPTRVKPQWSQIADQMMASGNGPARSSNGSR